MGLFFPGLIAELVDHFPLYFLGKLEYVVDNAAEFYGDAQNNQNVIFQVDN